MHQSLEGPLQTLQKKELILATMFVGQMERNGETL
jgi:hypothetical protein